MKKDTLVKEFSAEEKMVQGVILEVLNKEDRAHLTCKNPKDGVFTPLITFFHEHVLVTAIFYESPNIIMRMYEDISMDFGDFKDFKEKIRDLRQRIRNGNKSHATKHHNKRWMYFLYDKKRSEIMVSATIPINTEDRREKIKEILQTKFSFFIESTRMFYSGVFDEPVDPRKVEPDTRTKPQAVSQAASWAA